MPEPSIENAVSDSRCKTDQIFLFESPSILFVYGKERGAVRFEGCYGYRILDGYLHLLNKDKNVSASFNIGEWTAVQCR